MSVLKCSDPYTCGICIVDLSIQQRRNGFENCIYAQSYHYNKSQIIAECQYAVVDGQVKRKNFNGKKIDLSSVKLVFCDYDDTACIHLCVGVCRPTQDEWLDLFNKDMENTYTELIPCVPNVALKWFLSSHLKNIPKKILTWSDNTGLKNARKTFVDKYYPGEFDNVIISPARESKTICMSVLAQELELSNDEILIIEDHPSTLNEAKAAGFLAVSTAEINALYIDYMGSEEKSQNIASIEEIQEWKGKQSAMQPRQSGCTDANGVFHPINGIDGVPYDLCPRCEKLIVNHSFGKRRNFPKYCENCGQKLDWGSEIENQTLKFGVLSTATNTDPHESE